MPLLSDPTTTRLLSGLTPTTAGIWLAFAGVCLAGTYAVVTASLTGLVSVLTPLASLHPLAVPVLYALFCLVVLLAALLLGGVDCWAVRSWLHGKVSRIYSDKYLN